MDCIGALRLSMVSILVVGLTINACAERRLSPHPSQLAKEELEGIVRARLARDVESIRRDSTTWTNDRRVRCVPLPMYPGPDHTSKSLDSLAWHINFVEGRASREDRVRQLKQLDALVGAGVLQKTAKEIEINGVNTTTNQYGLTGTGWKVSATDRSPFCFMYGTPRLLDVSFSDPALVTGQTGIEVYTVVARVGVRENELEAWARSEDVQSAFPEIKRMVQGEESRRQLVRRENGWIPFECLQLQAVSKEHARVCESQALIYDGKPKAPKSAGQPAESLVLEKEKFVQQLEMLLAKDSNEIPLSGREDARQQALKKINDLKSLPPPTEEEIKALIRQHNEWEGGETEFIGLRLYFDKGYRFKYRTLTLLKPPPDRSIAPNILAQRIDLKLMSEYGKACSADYGFDLRSRRSHSGGGRCWDAVDKDSLKLEASKNSKDALLVGPPALDDAVTKGILRKADAKDTEAWVQTIMNKTPKQDAPSIDRQGQATLQRPSTYRAYVVLKDFIYPDGLYGGNLATFFIPKGVPAPIGNPGHSAIYDFNTLQCRGTTCARD